MSSYIYKDIKDKIRKSSMKVILETPQTYNLCVSFTIRTFARHMYVFRLYICCSYSFWD